MMFWRKDDEESCWNKNPLIKKNEWGQFNDNEIRRNFVRKVYALLTVQLIFTTILIAIFIFTPEIKEAMQSKGGGIFGLVLM